MKLFKLFCNTHKKAFTLFKHLDPENVLLEIYLRETQSCTREKQTNEQKSKSSKYIQWGNGLKQNNITI